MQFIRGKSKQIDIYVALLYLAFFSLGRGVDLNEDNQIKLSIFDDDILYKKSKILSTLEELILESSENTDAYDPLSEDIHVISPASSQEMNIESSERHPIRQSGLNIHPSKSTLVSEESHTPSKRLLGLNKYGFDHLMIEHPFYWEDRCGEDPFPSTFLTPESSFESNGEQLEPGTDCVFPDDDLPPPRPTFLGDPNDMTGPYRQNLEADMYLNDNFFSPGPISQYPYTQGNYIDPGLGRYNEAVGPGPGPGAYTHGSSISPGLRVYTHGDIPDAQGYLTGPSSGEHGRSNLIDSDAQLQLRTKDSENLQSDWIDHSEVSIGADMTEDQSEQIKDRLAISPQPRSFSTINYMVHDPVAVSQTVDIPHSSTMGSGIPPNTEGGNQDRIAAPNGYLDSSNCQNGTNTSTFGANGQINSDQNGQTNACPHINEEIHGRSLDFSQFLPAMDREDDPLLPVDANLFIVGRNNEIINIETGELSGQTATVIPDFFDE